jgi:hypothetical protein
VVEVDVEAGVVVHVVANEEAVVLVAMLEGVDREDVAGQMGEGLVAALMEAHTTPPLPRRRPACRCQR